MQRRKVLLLDLNPTGGVSDTPRSVLETSPGFCQDWCNFPEMDIESSTLPETFTASYAEPVVTSIHLDRDQDLIFILVTSHLVRQAATLIETIRRRNTEVPLNYRRRFGGAGGDVGLTQTWCHRFSH